MRKIAKDNEEALILVEEIEKLNKDKYYGMLYNVEEEQKKLERSARLTGYEEGVNVGMKTGTDINIISKCTGLTVSEIESLIN